MRAFDYVHLPETLLTPEISSLLSSIHEYRGKQDLYIEAKRDVLDALVEVAMIQSTDASNRIEGIFTSDIRLKQLVEEKVVPHNRNEKEIAGYRDVLATIHENFDFIPLTPNTILQLHRDLYSFLPEGMGGHWKNNDNIIAEPCRMEHSTSASSRFPLLKPRKQWSIFATLSKTQSVKIDMILCF